MAKIPWRMSLHTYVRWADIRDQILSLPPDSPEIPVLEDDARCLPGFPNGYNPAKDVIVEQVVRPRGPLGR